MCTLKSIALILYKNDIEQKEYEKYKEEFDEALILYKNDIEQELVLLKSSIDEMSVNPL